MIALKRDTRGGAVAPTMANLKHKLPVDNFQPKTTSIRLMLIDMCSTVWMV